MKARVTRHPALFASSTAVIIFDECHKARALVSAEDEATLISDERKANGQGRPSWRRKGKEKGGGGRGGRVRDNEDDGEGGAGGSGWGGKPRVPGVTAADVRRFGPAGRRTESDPLLTEKLTSGKGDAKEKEKKEGGDSKSIQAGSKTSLAILRLQLLLPHARVVYVSATGASEPR